MPQLTCYQLHFTGPVHLAERGIGIEETADLAHSDTLFSALCWALRLGWGDNELGRLLDAFRHGEPPFLLSSGFPFAGTVRFLPRPLLPLPAELPDALRKRWQSVRFISSDLFALWVRGDEPALRQALAAEQITADSDVGLTPAAAAHLPPIPADGGWFWRRVAVPRVTLDRTSNASALYFAGRLQFAPACGLALFIAWRDRQWQPTIERALAELGELGLGGLRSIGYGAFHVTVGEDLILPDMPAESQAVLLSLYAPLREELEAGVLGPGARYDFLVRGGWITAPDGTRYRRRTVRMLTEGGVIVQPATTPVRGTLVDVRPAIPHLHPVYRYGLALTVPARQGGR